MLSDRIDFSVLQAVAEAGWILVFVGRRQFRFSEHDKLDALLADGRMVELGEKNGDEVASIISQCDVGLVPYTLTKFNLASFPLKTLEYMAAGLPVLSTALPGVLWLDSPMIEIVTDNESINASLRKIHGRSKEESAREALRFAANHTWAARAGHFESLLTGNVDD